MNKQEKSNFKNKLMSIIRNNQKAPKVTSNRLNNMIKKLSNSKI